MVYKIDKANEVQISFYAEDGLTIKASIKITDKDFRMRMIKGIRENIAGFALINIDFPQFDIIPSVKLSTYKRIPVATPICLIGYSNDNQNIAIKPGIVSSYCKQNGSKFLQFDASVDRGNSGAPLFDVDTCEVVGIVGQRLANINDGYKRMMSIINANLEVLKEAEGKINLHDIDPVQVLVANQNQIKALAQEFMKNASFNYGFALDINHVSEFIDIAELEKENLLRIDFEGTDMLDA
jgi:hypothetical protein